jgi:hypothetical protein
MRLWRTPVWRKPFREAGRETHAADARST